MDKKLYPNQLRQACKEGDMSIVTSFDSQFEYYSIKDGLSMACEFNQIEVAKYIYPFYKKMSEMYKAHMLGDFLELASQKGSLEVLGYLIENEQRGFKLVPDVANRVIIQSMGHRETFGYALETYEDQLTPRILENYYGQAVDKNIAHALDLLLKKGFCNNHLLSEKCNALHNQVIWSAIKDGRINVIDYYFKDENYGLLDKTSVMEFSGHINEATYSQKICSHVETLLLHRKMNEKIDEKSFDKKKNKI